MKILEKIFNKIEIRNYFILLKNVKKKLRIENNEITKTERKEIFVEKDLKNKEKNIYKYININSNKIYKERGLIIFISKKENENNNIELNKSKGAEDDYSCKKKILQKDKIETGNDSNNFQIIKNIIVDILNNIDKAEMKIGKKLIKSNDSKEESINDIKNNDLDETMKYNRLKNANDISKINLTKTKTINNEKKNKYFEKENTKTLKEINEESNNSIEYDKCRCKKENDNNADIKTSQESKNTVIPASDNQNSKSSENIKISKDKEILDNKNKITDNRNNEIISNRLMKDKSIIEKIMPIEENKNGPCFQNDNNFKDQKTFGGYFGGEPIYQKELYIQEQQNNDINTVLNNEKECQSK